MTANNLANASTSGYREQRVSFSEVLADDAAPTRHLVAVGRPMVSRERGAIEQTNRALDLSIQEEGYFVAEQQGNRVLLRSASTEIDADGNLRDAAGRRLAFAGGDGFIDPARPITFGDRGQVMQDGREVARLLVVNVADPRALAPTGAGAYSVTSASGQAFPVSASVVSGGLERSNVNPVSNMVRMVALERDFQSITRVIHAYREADEGIISAAGDS